MYPSALTSCPGLTSAVKDGPVEVLLPYLMIHVCRSLSSSLYWEILSNQPCPEDQLWIAWASLKFCTKIVLSSHTLTLTFRVRGNFILQVEFHFCFPSQNYHFSSFLIISLGQWNFVVLPMLLPTTVGHFPYRFFIFFFFHLLSKPVFSIFSNTAYLSKCRVTLHTKKTWHFACEVELGTSL